MKYYRYARDGFAVILLGFTVTFPFWMIYNSIYGASDPKPVKTTKIELPLSVQRLAGVPVPKNRPLDYDPEHVAAVLAWRLEFHREIHCQTHIC